MSMIKNKLSIKTKLVLMIFLTSFAVLLLENAAFIVYERMKVKEEILNDMGAFARIISNRSAASLIQNDGKMTQENLDILKVEKAVVSAAIYDAQDNIVARYDSGEERAFEFPLKSNLATNMQTDSDYLYLSEPIMQNGVLVGNVLIRASFRELNLHWHNFLLYRALMIFVVSIVTLVIAMRLQRIISRPLERLTTTAKTVVVNRNYRMRIPVESEDEFGALAHAFNSILEAIETHDHALQQSNQRLAMFEQDTNYPTELLALASLQVGTGIECVAGNVEVYRKQLHRFREHYANATQELQRLLTEEQDIPATENYCNALKGVAGNIGATALYECVTHICATFKQSQLPNTLDFSKMQALLAAVIADIDSLALMENHQHLPPNKNFSSRVLSEKTSALLAAFEDDLGATENLVTELCAVASGSEFETLADAIAVQLDEFNIDQATLLLTDLQQRLLAQS